MHKNLYILILLLFSTLSAWPQSGVNAADTSLAFATEFLQQYIKIPSLSGREYHAAKYFEQRCLDAGLFITSLPSTDSSYQFAATLEPLITNKPVVWLHHHIDVVPAVDTTNWKHKPYSGFIEQDTLWGRGTLDAKGLGVMQFMALQRIKHSSDTSDLPFNIGLLCLANEESGDNPNIRRVLTRYARRLKPLAAYGEGGSGLYGVLERSPNTPVYGISVAEKMALWLRLEVEVESFGHGATPAPQYANKVLIRALGRLEDRKMKLEFNRVNKRMFRRLGRAEGGLRGFVIRHMNWWIFSPLVKNIVSSDPLLESLTTNTITVTKLENPPGPTNQISPTATAYLDCRLQPTYNQKAFLKKLSRILNEDAIKITVENQSPEAKPSTINRYFQAFEQAIKQVEPEAEVIPILFPATTDNSHLRRYGVPTYGIVPALLNEELVKSVHSSNERIPLTQLEAGSAIYTQLLRNLILELEDKRLKIPELANALN